MRVLSVEPLIVSLWINSPNRTSGDDSALQGSFVLSRRPPAVRHFHLQIPLSCARLPAIRLESQPFSTATGRTRQDKSSVVDSDIDFSLQCSRAMAAHSSPV